MLTTAGAPRILIWQRANASGATLTARPWSLDRLQLALLEPGAWSIRIPPSDHDQTTLVLLPLDGSAAAGNLRGRSAIEHGEMYVHVHASGELVAVDVDDEVAVVLIPGVPTRHWTSGMRRRPPVVIDTHSGVPSVVAHLIETLVRDGDADARGDSTTPLAQHVVGLLSLACNEVLDDCEPGAPDLLQRAIEHIDRHLGDAGLTPDRVAEAVCVSTRTLHRIFEREGLTVSGCIRQRRLENCRAELADPRMSHYPVSAIGARWGMPTAPHFSKLFKTTYGVSPRTFRARSVGRHDDSLAWRELRTA